MTTYPITLDRRYGIAGYALYAVFGLAVMLFSLPQVGITTGWYTIIMGGLLVPLSIVNMIAVARDKYYHVEAISVTIAASLLAPYVFGAIVESFKHPEGPSPFVTLGVGVFIICAVLWARSLTLIRRWFQNGKLFNAGRR